MADTMLAVHKALGAALAGMTTIAADGGADVAVAVYDQPPANAPFPFVTLASQAVAPDDTLDGYHYGVHSVYLAIWSQYRGQRQVLDIMETIKDRLHDATLVLEAGECLLCRVSNRATTREPDDITYQGAMTVRVIAAEE